MRMRLARPFGIDTERFRPPSPEERSAARQQLGIAPDELCAVRGSAVLLFQSAPVSDVPRSGGGAPRGLQSAFAARRLGRRAVNLAEVSTGSRGAYSGLKTTIVDAMRPDNRFRVWKAADVFTSLSDNIQETLGADHPGSAGVQVAGGDDRPGRLPKRRSRRDRILVSTRMVAGATADGTSRHLMGETSYGEFLGETNQAVAVDSVEATNAFERLFGDAALRAPDGARRGSSPYPEQSTWPLVIQQYEAVWLEQEAIRREHATAAAATACRQSILQFLFPMSNIRLPPTRAPSSDPRQRWWLLRMRPSNSECCSSCH